MSTLPTGTVTFLFTDVEGSTRLWEEHPAETRPALVRHDALIERLADEHAGQVVRPRGEGDSRFAVFARASDAVAAAAAIQSAFHAEPWPTPSPLAVRMALHTGEADLRGGDYYGTAVNRCARLRAIAHGGQTLLSDVTADLVRDALPVGAALRDLGEQRLKDLQRTERVFQLVLDALPDAFPPLKSLEARPNNLPAQPTRLIGREREVAEAGALLTALGTRLLTLTGPGGTGKTRLGLQLASVLLDHFPDGVFFVALAPIADPDLVIPTIAHTLGLAESAGRDRLAVLVDYLRNRLALLVLDNFEQILPAARQVGELLATCPRLKLLVTSRAPLRLYGEQEYPVPPLGVPATGEGVAPLADYDSVRLFVERARGARPDFALTAENAPAIADICRRLDGLPLGIELAAARVRVLTPPAIVARLESGGLGLLTGGARDLPARQQTLRGAIGWSYDLLGPDEQRLFRRLAVFVGGCDLEAAEAVCGPDALDGVTALVEASLMRQSDGVGGEPRFWMLEMVREYGLERLAAPASECPSEIEDLRRAHAAYFADLVSQTDSKLTTAALIPFTYRLEREQDNVRTALRWCTERGEIETGLRLVAGNWLYYWRGAMSEGRHWAAPLLARSGSPSPPRAYALFVDAMLAWQQLDPAARAAATASADLWRQIGDRRWLGRALNWQALTLTTSQPEDAHLLAEEALRLARETGDGWGTSVALNSLGLAALALGDVSAARRHQAENVALCRTMGDPWLRGFPLTLLGSICLREGDFDEAEALLTEALASFAEPGDKPMVGTTLGDLGWLALRRGDATSAAERFREGLMLFRDAGVRVGQATAVEGLAAVHASRSQPAIAVRLFAAAAAERGRSPRAALFSGESHHILFQQALADARASLGEAAFATAWAQGETIALSDAIAEALAD